MRRIKRWGYRLLWLLPVGLVLWLGIHVTRHAPPDPIPPAQKSKRFGLSEEKRREVFEDIAEWDARWRRWAKQEFPNSKWSREDHYHNLLRMHVEKLIDRHELNYAVIYLIYDEGIRQRWPTPEGDPLRPTTVPLEPPPP